MSMLPVRETAKDVVLQGITDSIQQQRTCLCKHFPIPNVVGSDVRNPMQETLNAYKWQAEDMKRRCITKQSSELASRIFIVVGFGPCVRKLSFLSSARVTLGFVSFGSAGSWVQCEARRFGSLRAGTNTCRGRHGRSFTEARLLLRV